MMKELKPNLQQIIDTFQICKTACRVKCNLCVIDELSNLKAAIVADRDEMQKLLNHLKDKKTFTARQLKTELAAKIKLANKILGAEKK